MAQEFSRVKVGTNKRSSFDLSHYQVTTTDFGKLVPICVRECLPHDEITLDPKVFIRLAPLAVPTFGHIKARVHTFFVPNRILWKGWDNWINGLNTSSLPYFTTTQLHDEASFDPAYISYVEPLPSQVYPRGQITDLFTNLGLSQEAVSHYQSVTFGNYKLNPFAFLAYQRIWFDYFRDSNINQDEAWFDNLRNHSSGMYSNILVHQMVQLRRACFKKDYFTTAKLNPQDGADAALATAQFNRAINSASTGLLAVHAKTTNGSNSIELNVTNTDTSSNRIVSAISVPVLRAATALQRYLERNNFVGSRPIARALAHFGIAPSAERLDMSEYLGAHDFPVQIADVTSTSLYSATEPDPMQPGGLGTQAGKGIAAGNGQAINYHAKEHGILMSVLSILPDTGYYQGLPKWLTRGYVDGKFDYFTPEFENLGFQPILTRELVSDSSHPEQIFGYTPKYSEYKFQMDVLAGDFTARGTNTGGDSYHLFRKLESTDAVLNTSFTECGFNNQMDYDRIFQVPSEDGLDHFYCNINCFCQMVRQMSSFASPSIINSEEGDGQRIDLPYGGTRL